MCGLYSNRKMAAEMSTVFGLPSDLVFQPRMYITPGGPMEIVRLEGGQRQLAIVRWGLVPGWAKQMRAGKPLINARSETVLEKPSFRGGIKHRRCLVPADGYFEWQGDVPGKKQPFYITRPDGALFAFAGIWEHWMAPDGSELESAAILTTGADETIAPVHHRMPVVVDGRDFDLWLDSTQTPAAKALQAVLARGNGSFALHKTTIERPRRSQKSTSQSDAKPKSGQLPLF